MMIFAILTPWLYVGNDKFVGTIIKTSGSQMVRGDFLGHCYEIASLHSLSQNIIVRPVLNLLKSCDTICGSAAVCSFWRISYLAFTNVLNV